MKANTKESRLNSRAYQFNYLIEKGYKHKTYKELDFFTIDEGKYFTLKVYRGTAANHELYCNYHTAERRSAVIEGLKNSYESHQQYKAEQKEKNKGKSSSHAAASAAIKEELQKTFPNIKFSVRSESFSMGDSVHISWADGVTAEQVKSISSKYQYGHFNGMEDIYESSNRREDIPQAKYVSESRNMSKEAEAILLPIAERIFNEIKASGNDQPFNCRDAANFLYRIFVHTNFIGNPVNIVKTEVTCGLSSPEVFYKIVFDKEEEQPQPKAEQIEATAGEVNIVDYSDKAFAVIGDFSAHYDNLINLGGKYNKFLKCGRGIIFSKTKLEAVENYFAQYEDKAPEEPTEPANIEADDKQPNFETPQTEVFILESFKIIWHEGKQTPNFEGKIFTTWEEVQKAFYKLWEMNEKGQDGGYTKVKVEMKFKGQEIIINRIDITNKINNGDFNPSNEHILTYLQTIEEEETTEPTPTNYNSLPEISQAAKTGKVISLFNLSELVNAK